MNSFKVSLAKELKSNPLCAVTAYIGQRVFHRVVDGKDEVLCLLSFEGSFRGWVWGHVFFKEGQWFCVLANFPDDTAGMTSDELFEWHNWCVKNRGNYEPLKVQKEGEAFSSSDTFEEAVCSLQKMISAFDPAKRVPREGDTVHEGSWEMDIFDAYDFPLCTPELWEPSPYERKMR